MPVVPSKRTEYSDSISTTVAAMHKRLTQLRAFRNSDKQSISGLNEIVPFVDEVVPLFP